jgi:hypothetical protein
VYITRQAGPEFRKLINPRRGAIKSVPLLTWSAAEDQADALLHHFKLQQYVGCTTGEMRKRPVPHVFKLEHTKALTDLYISRGPEVLRRFIQQLRPPLQPLNKTSRLGWPFFSHPDSKRATLLPAFSDLEQRGAEAALDGCFILLNVRLQAESVKKKRVMMFLHDDGTVYEEDVLAKDREIKSGSGHTRVGSRTRLVFNMPFANLYKQVLDTAIHNVELSYPVFHHNMYAKTGTLAVEGDTFFFDVKHFERHTAAIARARADIIGGLYGSIVREFTRAPFLCPTDTWKDAYFLWPDRAAGWSDQFASGDSAVAPLQKEVFACLYMEVAEKIRKVSRKDSLNWVLQGGDKFITIRNYGDDNSLNGDKGAMAEAFHLIRDYLEAEEELPPKFLGFLWTKDGWRLGVESYITKTYLNERRPYSNFRKYPCFGWVEKRNVYRTYGVAELEGEVFPMENHLLTSNGHPWSEVLIASQKEAMLAGSEAGSYTTPSFLLDKDYLMSNQEKVDSGLYEGLYPEETRSMIQRLLGPDWRSVLP